MTRQEACKNIEANIPQQQQLSIAIECITAPTPTADIQEIPPTAAQEEHTQGEKLWLFKNIYDKILHIT